MMVDEENKMCPSSKAQVGAKLLGIRQSDGTVAILPQPLELNSQFIEIATQHAIPEQQFRFVNKCVKSGCAQWTGSRCGLADKIVSVVNELPVNSDLPKCSIRPECRWFSQNGADACRICPFVVTHTTEKEWERQNLIAGLNR